MQRRNNPPAEFSFRGTEWWSCFLSCIRGASVLLMPAWVLWLFRQTGYRPKPFARSLIRHGAVMGSIYGVTLAATMAVAYVAGVA